MDEGTQEASFLGTFEIETGPLHNISIYKNKQKKQKKTPTLSENFVLCSSQLVDKMDISVRNKYEKKSYF